VPACASRGHLDRDCSDHRLRGHVCPQQFGFARQSPILRCTDDVFGFQLVRFSQKLKEELYAWMPASSHQAQGTPFRKIPVTVGCRADTVVQYLSR
jgi:hypothetical protein